MSQTHVRWRRNQFEGLRSGPGGVATLPQRLLQRSATNNLLQRRVNIHLSWRLLTRDLTLQLRLLTRDLTLPLNMNVVLSESPTEAQLMTPKRLNQLTNLWNAQLRYYPKYRLKVLWLWNVQRRNVPRCRLKIPNWRTNLWTYGMSNGGTTRSIDWRGRSESSFLDFLRIWTFCFEIVHFFQTASGVWKYIFFVTIYIDLVVLFLTGFVRWKKMFESCISEVIWIVFHKVNAKSYIVIAVNVVMA